MAELADDNRCPCLSGNPYGECCARFHRGETAAPTAELLMRSRYSAFAAHDAAYLLDTWHPRTRPAEVRFEPGLRWLRLDIVATSGGGMLATEGTVEFAAFYRDENGRGELHETSRFVRENGTWFYLDGDAP
ncbi:YchJ family metal-binding protein [Okibacterium endophyticum]